MVTFAIGDVQGCAVTLQRLLARLRLDAGFDPTRDALWLTGDLVNRGPRSLDVLRWAHDQAANGSPDALGPRLRVVLGNHDLHLIARAAGVAEPGRKDTLADILAAPDRDALVDWLRRQPLLHVEAVDGRPHALVHAGLPPEWSVARAAELAGELHEALAGPHWREASAEIKRHKTQWNDTLTGGPRLGAIAAALTRLRIVGQAGDMELDFKGRPSDAPEGTLPWFAVPGRASADHVIVCGHWAALGLQMTDDLVACDSGCVWGGTLTAVRLAASSEGRAVWQEGNAEGVGSAGG